MYRLLELIRRAPATVSFVVGLWVVGGITGSLLHGPSSQLRHTIGASVPALFSGRVYTLVSSAVWSHGLGGYLLVTAAMLAVGGAVERRSGWLRLVCVGLLTQVLGTALGLGAVALVARAGGSWGEALAVHTTLGPTPMIVGVWLAYSASAEVLWRQRIRLGVLVLMLTMMLYGGLLSDVLRFCTALVGLTIGGLVLGRGRHTLIQHPSRRETRVLIAMVVAASAVGALLASLSPVAVGPLSVLRYLFASPSVPAAKLQQLCADPSSAQICAELRNQSRYHGLGPSALSVLPALLVLLIAEGLRRGRRFAWWAAISLHIVLTGFGLLLAVAGAFRPDWDASVLNQGGPRAAASYLLPLVQPLVILVVLMMFRSSFPVRAPSRTYLRVAITLGAATLTLLVCYVLIGTWMSGRFAPSPTPAQLAADFPLRLIPPRYLGVVEPGFLPRTVLSTVLYEWTGVALWMIVIVVVLRSFVDRAVSVGDDSSHVLKVLAQHGSTSLSYLTTWTGNSYWFSESGRTYVAYRVSAGAAITTGDPIGPTDERIAAVVDFVSFCRKHSWTPCFYSVTAAVREVTNRLGWPSVQVAEDTVLPLSGLAFTGKKFQDVRTALNRAGRAGITAEWISYPTANRSMTAQIRSLSEEWLAGKGLPEMGFTLGGLDELDDKRVRCLVAVDDEQRLHGVTSWLPAYDGGVIIGWTLDFMRRSPTAFPGVMEFLIGSAALRFQAEGFRFVSLSGAPLARVDGGTAPSGLQGVLDHLGGALEPVYGFRSLLAFKAKFSPTYRPLYMAYPEIAVLPRIASGIGRAYLPRMSLRQSLQLFRRR